jgi:hypothetical protein
MERLFKPFTKTRGGAFDDFELTVASRKDGSHVNSSEPFHSFAAVFDEGCLARMWQKKLIC